MPASFPTDDCSTVCVGNYWGMKMIDSMYSFVTSGIGVYGPDMRVGTNSEVMVIDVHFE